MPVVAVRGTRADLAAALRLVPAIVAGRHPDPTGLAEQVAARAGNACLSQLTQDFLTKSRGGTGRDGVRWKPLDPKTIAQRRVSGAEKKQLGIGGRRVRGLLTPAQDRLWRQIYGTRLARLRLHMGEGEARAAAGRIAWAELKRLGAKTKLAALGGRTVDIGRDTARMLKSFAAGVEARPSGAADQVFEARPGLAIVGTTVPYFPHFNSRRPVWPPDGTIPPAWWPAIVLAARRGALAVAEVLAREAR